MALLEVQIEGSNGWASNLPTWKIDLPLSVVGMWGGGEKPLTGYHSYLWLLTFGLPHFAFLFTKWNIKKEIYLISFYIFYSTVEGILWFAVNPFWGWRSFRKENIDWYQETLGIWITG